MQRAVRAAAMVAMFLSVGNPALVGAADRVWFVPWQVLDPGAEAAPSLFALYWIPSSPEELKRSDLVTSRALAIYSSRCVAMYVIRIDDAERLRRFGAGEVPVALLVEGEREIARVTPATGTVLRASDVEAMVRSGFEARESACAEDLEKASELARAGHTDAAAALYERVALRRCAFPRLARQAQRALSRMRR